MPELFDACRNRKSPDLDMKSVIAITCIAQRAFTGHWFRVCDLGRRKCRCEVDDLHPFRHPLKTRFCLRDGSWVISSDQGCKSAWAKPCV